MVEKEPGLNPEPLAAGEGSIPAVVHAARWLFVLLGLTWLVFGVWSIVRMGHTSSSVPAALLWFIAILMFVNALLLIWVGWGLGRGNRLYFYFGLILLAGNIFLTFTDEFGAFDLITLILNVVLLVLLIFRHSKFLQNN
jgi:hypothetical protein